MPVSKDTHIFLQDPTVSKWASSLSSERGRLSYAYHLKRFLVGLETTPAVFLSEIEASPKQVSIKTKSYLGAFPSKATARIMLNAVKSFVRFYEAELPLNGLKVKVKRTRKKPYLSWPDAERILGASKEPYRSTFRFLLWSGLGLDELAEINHSTEIQAAITKQLSDASKSYVRIDLRPRKSNTDTYFVLVPKQFVPAFPVTTLIYDGTIHGKRKRGGKLVSNLVMETNWTRACKRVGLHQIGLGPHTLRSAFRSQCAKVGVSDAVAEFSMGHGSRDVHGYSRETEDESYLVNELSKLWNATVPVTTAELVDRDKRIATLEQVVADLQRAANLRIIIDAEPDADKRAQRLATSRPVP
jgi:hypothetical protein